MTALLPRRRDAAGALGRRRRRRRSAAAGARSSCCGTSRRCGTRRRDRRDSSTPRSCSRRRTALAAALYSVARHAPRHVHRLGRPPRQPGVLLHRSRGQRHRALLGPRAHRLVVDARPDRDGDAVPRPQRVPARAPDRGGGARRDRRRMRHPSVTCICRWGMSPPRAPSTSTRSGSTRRPGWATRPCSSARAATTTTWR